MGYAYISKQTTQGREDEIMQVDKGWKPGASDRERSNREHGVWVSRPYGLRARETRARDARAWRADQGAQGLVTR
jgi:hypothetical protein